MFLISNVEMMVAVAEAGILGGIPALNHRTSAALESALSAIRQRSQGPIAANLICKRAYNPRQDVDLELCLLVSRLLAEYEDTRASLPCLG